ncbi:hypothetical protein AB0H83_47405 [Dactylosporangium sp. NPDC050688]|uniref:hypothetical protein n=1 Tax=Dactylosporangium sp. NPDC050688 TaxID=3157217 RepID=UPI0033C63AA9
MLLDPGMVTWARVVLLQDKPRRYELVQAYRIMTTVRPQVYRPRLARALGDLVDGFTAAAPADAVEELLTEAASNLLTWARELVRASPGTMTEPGALTEAGALTEPGALTEVDVLTEVVTRQRRRRAADDGPDWDLLAVAVALEEAGRAGAALTAVQELIAVERRRRQVRRGRLAIAIAHAAGILERRERSYDAAALRAQAEPAAGPRSNGIAERLAGIPQPAAARKPGRGVPGRGVPGNSRTPAPSR